MISEFTAPNTKVVFIEKGAICTSVPKLEFGATYTVHSIELGRCPHSKQEIAGVNLVEKLSQQKRGLFRLEWFDYLSLPQSILDCFDANKIPDSVKREVADDIEHLKKAVF